MYEFVFLENVLTDSYSTMSVCDVSVFYDEVMVTIERALSENIGLDNMIVEINSLK